MRRLLRAATILAAIAVAWGCGDGNGDGSPTGVDDDGSPPVGAVAAFADSALEAAIRAALGKPDDELTEDDLLSLTQLEAQARGISDLTGIGKLRNLTVLDLSKNKIEDISPLSALTRLILLDLTGNQIDDVSPLTALAVLEALVLDDNHIQDIAPLLQLEHLNSLELTGNPLNVASVDQAMPLLQAHGIEIAFRPSSSSDSQSYTDFDIAYVGKRSPNSRRTDIFLRNTDGSAAINLTDDSSLYSNLTWSPDGSTIAFIWSFDSDLQNLYFSNIVVMNSDGSNLVDLTQAAENHTLHTLPAWSPDGTRIAFTRFTTSSGADVVDAFAVYVANADGSHCLSVANSESDGSRLSQPVWSPDGNEIAFMRYIPDNSGLLGNSDLHVVDANGGSPVSWTPGTDPVGFYLSWAPGSRIAITGILPEGPGDVYPQVYVANQRGGDWLEATDFPAYGNLSYPRWSPDGTRISAIYDRDIWIVDPDGGDMLNLTNHDPALSAFDYAWRP